MPYTAVRIGYTIMNDIIFALEKFILLGMSIFSVFCLMGNLLLWGSARDKCEHI